MCSDPDVPTESKFLSCKDRATFYDAFIFTLAGRSDHSWATRQPRQPILVIKCYSKRCEILVGIEHVTVMGSYLPLILTPPVVRANTR